MIVESRIENPKSKIGMRADPKWLNLELPGSPVPWTTAVVGHGENLHRRFYNPINYAIGEAAEERPLRAVQVHRPSLRSAQHLPDRVIELGYESICRGEIAFGIPLIGSSRLCDGLGMELNAWTSHEPVRGFDAARRTKEPSSRSEEHTSELQSRGHLVCRLLLEKKKNKTKKKKQ